MTATQDATSAITDFQEAASGAGGAVDAGVQRSFDDYVKLGQQIRQVGGELAQQSKQFIDAYAEEQAAVGALTSALEAQGQATPAIISQYQEIASQFQA